MELRLNNLRTKICPAFGGYWCAY